MKLTPRELEKLQLHAIGNLAKAVSYTHLST